MPSVSPHGSFRTTRLLPNRILAYALAILLPTLSSALMARSPVLLTIPFSLYFISIGVIAVLDGLAPAMLAVLFCVISRRYFIAPGEVLLALNPAGFYRLFVLVLCALLISGIDRRRRRTTLRLEIALRNLQERNSALAESLHSTRCASWSRDFTTGGDIRWYNGSFQVFGRPFSEMEKPGVLLSCLHPEDRERLPAIIERMKTRSDPITWEYRVLWPDGEMHWLEMRATRVPGPAPVWRGVTVDVTERKLAELTLLRTEKLAAMGRLASTVAHEINNPLESVTNLLYLASSDPGLSDDTRNYLATAEQELARLGDITRLTLGFVRNSAAPAEVDVAVVVEEVLSIFRHRLESKAIRVQREFSGGIEVRIAAHELRQILTNLISNASDALSGPSPCIRIRIAREADCAALSVEDNGSGIPEPVRVRIFEPFFTTKPDVGTGIGLWVTRELVEKYGGRIAVQSGDLPHGMKTRFHLEFPLRGGAAVS
jgi:PAS domain S-box-containing protein